MLSDVTLLELLLILNFCLNQRLLRAAHNAQMLLICSGQYVEILWWMWRSLVFSKVIGSAGCGFGHFTLSAAADCELFPPLCDWK